ncbi:MAG: peptidylprolyl isomerase [Clostridia bacterium]|nr:peptidylprolyl isomerase [Clostridia bacterium]
MIWNKIRKIMALSIACLLCVLSLTLASCSSSGTAMSYKGKTLSESDYAYIMSFLKGYYDYYYTQYASYYGATITLEDLYDRAGDDGVTFAEQLRKTVDETAMMMLVVEQLCDELGIRVQDETTIEQIRQSTQDLKDDYGGEDALEISLAKLGFSTSSLERYEYYNALLTLLKEYRYGENGIARLPDEDVRKEFDASYVKSEGYVYSYYETDASGSRTERVVDLTGSISDAEVEAAFPRLFVKAEYLSFGHGEDAEQALGRLTGGTDPSDLYETADAHIEPTCILLSEAEKGVYAGLNADGAWHLVAEEDGSYVVRVSEVSSSDLAGNEPAVKEALVAEKAEDFFKDNYVTVQHILYDLADEEKAKAVYDGLVAGTTTFEEHLSETMDGGSKYTFTKGKMATEFEQDSFALAEGSYSLTKTTYGWHVIQRLPLDPDGFVLSDVLSAMSRDLIRSEAEAAYQTLKSGTVPFSAPAEDAGYAYSEPTVLKLSNLNGTMANALKDAKVGEVVYLDLPGNGVYILRKLETEQADLDSVADDILSPLQSQAFHDYLSGFYDQVSVNDEAVGRFNIRTRPTFYY